MDSLNPEMLEHVLSFCDQSSKITCSQVSKSLHDVSMNPRVWTTVNLCCVSPEAQAFLKRCVQCTSVSMWLEDDGMFHQFAASTYPESIVSVTARVQGGEKNPVCHLFLYHIFKAFPGLRDLDVEFQGLADAQVVNVPRKTLDTFRFHDVGNPDQRVHLDFDGPLTAGAVDIRVDSTNMGTESPDTAVDALVVCASGISSGLTVLPPTVRDLTIDVDGNYILDIPLAVDHLRFTLGGSPDHSLFIPMTVVKQHWKVKHITITLVDDPMDNVEVEPVLLFRETTAKEFYDYFYGPQREVELVIAEDVAFAVLPL